MIGMRVLTANYAHVKSAQNATTGLVPDWSQDNGSPDARGPNYTFDASRTPWRMALAYIWYGDASAKEIANKMNAWIKTSTAGEPSQIMSGYQLGGTKLGNFNLPTYLGPFATGAMVDAAHQAWLDACYTKLASFIDNDNYYNESLQLITLLTMTGNMLDFSSVTPKTAFTITTGVSPATAGSVTVTPAKATYALNEQVTLTAVATGENKFVSWGGDVTGTTATKAVTVASDMNVTAYFNAGASDLIDDGEDGDHLTKMGTKWFTYDDILNKGASVVTPKTSSTALFAMATGGANSSTKSAKISFTLNKGTNLYNPFVGFGFPLNPLGDSTLVNISASSGLTFYHKGATCDVRVETLNITDFGYFFKRLPAAADWTLVSLKWADFAQATWAVKATMDLTKATKIAWQTTDIGKTGDMGDINIDDVHLPGYVVMRPDWAQAPAAGRDRRRAEPEPLRAARPERASRPRLPHVQRRGTERRLAAGRPPALNPEGAPLRGTRGRPLMGSGNEEFPPPPVRPVHRDHVDAARLVREGELAMRGGGGRDQLAMDIGHPDPGSLADAFEADPPRRIGSRDAAEGLAGRLRTRARGAAEGILLEEGPYLVGLDQVGRAGPLMPLPGDRVHEHGGPPVAGPVADPGHLGIRVGRGIGARYRRGGRALVQLQPDVRVLDERGRALAGAESHEHGDGPLEGAGRHGVAGHRRDGGEDIREEASGREADESSLGESRHVHPVPIDLVPGGERVEDGLEEGEVAGALHVRPCPRRPGAGGAGIDGDEFLPVGRDVCPWSRCGTPNRSRRRHGRRRRPQAC